MRTDPARRPRLPNAPLVPLALAVAAGVAADRYAVSWSTPTWAAIALAGAIVAAVGLWRRGSSVAVLLVAWMALGGGWHHYRWSDLADDDLARRVSEASRPAWLRGVLAEVPTYRPGTRPEHAGTTRTVLEVSAVGDGRRWHTASGRVQVLISGDRTDLKAGEPASAAGDLAAVAGPLNPGEFDYRAFLRAQGVRLRLVVGDSQGIWPDPDAPPPSSPQAAVHRTLTRWLGAARTWSHARLTAGLDPKIAPLAAALLLGRREGVDPETNDAFGRTGTTHLLAISGLHLQVLAVVLWMGFLVLGLGRRRSLLAVALATVAYALLVGLAPSVVRSAAMTVMVCGAAMWDRPARTANILAMAALVTLLLNPAHLFDVGCQLSFLAVAAIVWLVMPVERLLRFAYYSSTFRFHGPNSPLDALERKYESWWRPWIRWPRVFVLQGMTVSLVAWLVALPLVALRFHLVSPIGILLNVPLVPLTSMALFAAGLALAGSAVWAPLGMLPAWACARMLDLTEGMVRWGAAQPWGHAFVPGPPWWWVLAFYVCLASATLAGAARCPAWRAAWGVLGGWTALGVVLSLTPFRPGALEADVLAVGHGLAVVIQAADGRTLVYDCGRMGDPGVGRRLIAQALWARGVRHLDAVILSHPDSDHFNGLPDLLERFSIGTLRVTAGFAKARSSEPARLLERVRARGVPIRTIAEGERLAIGPGATLTVLHPPAGWRPDAADNDRSVVLDLTAGVGHFLLTGDLERAGLAELHARPTRRFDVVLTPHHGGRTSSPTWFFDWADPIQVVVSQRRPSAGTRDPLAVVTDRQVPVLRTWERGAIRLRWNPSGLTVRGFLDEAPVALVQSPSLAMATVAPAWLRALLTVLGLTLGFAACGILAVVEWGAWILVRPGRRLRAAVPETDPWQPIEARAADGVPLLGAWLPACDDRGRTLLVLHGFAEDRSTMRDRAEALARHGWDVALPDARGHGRSGGDHASFGGREADDLRAWVDALSDREGPARTVAVWGRSMGAAVALRAAADDPRIAALVLEAPYPDLEWAVEGWLARVRVPRRLAGLIVRRAAALAGVSLSRPRPIDVAPRVGVPTLILHGTDDPVVPLADARRLAEAFRRPALLIDVAGARHVDVIDIGGPELLDRIATFLDRAVSPPAP